MAFGSYHVTYMLRYNYETLGMKQKGNHFTDGMYKFSLTYGNRIWWLYRSTLVEVIQTISSANWPPGSGIIGPFKWTGNHIYLGLKITETCNPKMVFKVCEGISCSSFCVKELDVIVHKKYFPCTLLFKSNGIFFCGGKIWCLFLRYRLAILCVA